MHSFHYGDGRLHCEDVDLARVAREFSAGSGKALHTLEIRESRSSLAGAFMAAASEGGHGVESLKLHASFWDAPLHSRRSEQDLQGSYHRRFDGRRGQDNQSCSLKSLWRRGVGITEHDDTDN